MRLPAPPSLATALAQPVVTHDDVEYATVGGRALHMDIVLPTDGSQGPWPVVLFVHGGGWTGGTYNPPFSPAVNRLPASGLAVASVQYRLTSQAGQWGEESVTFPVQIHDVKGAVRFLKANAEQYNIDPTRVGAWGSSAGAHLVALLGTSGDVAQLEGTIGGNLEHSSRVQAVVDLYGPTDFLNMMPDVTEPPGSNTDHDAWNSPESRLIGFSQPGQGIGVLRANIDNPAAPFPEMAERVRNASPLTWITPDDPPFFIIHGEMDTTVPIHQSQRLADALTETGIPHVLIRQPGMGHQQPPTDVSLHAIEFLVEALSITSTSESFSVY